jgi:hypothetical protein
MKIALTLALLLTSAFAKAQCCPSQCESQPKVKYITKTKVVEKIVEKPVPFVVEKEVVKLIDRPVLVKTTKTVYKNDQKKNRISVLGGTGPTKLGVSTEEARLERGAVFGVQYQRTTQSGLSLGLQIQSNQTVLGSAGLDF